VEIIWKNNNFSRRPPDCFLAVLRKRADTSSNTEVVFGKTQVPEIGAFPYLIQKIFFIAKKLGKVESPHEIKFKIKFQDIPELSFSIYPRI